VLFAEKLTSEILASVPHRHWTFSIPRVLRGLVERERKLLGLLLQTAYASMLKTFQALFDRKDVRPGCVVVLQTFGSFGCNFHPHAHAIISDGVFTPEGEFLPLPSLDTSAVLEVFRRLLLRRLHEAESIASCDTAQANAARRRILSSPAAHPAIPRQPSFDNSSASASDPMALRDRVWSRCALPRRCMLHPGASKRGCFASRPRKWGQAANCRAPTHR
jgi:hypothetical protein